MHADLFCFVFCLFFLGRQVWWGELELELELAGCLISSCMLMPMEILPNQRMVQGKMTFPDVTLRNLRQRWLARKVLGEQLALLVDIACCFQALRRPSLPSVSETTLHTSLAKLGYDEEDHANSISLRQIVLPWLFAARVLHAKMMRILPGSAKRSSIS